MIGPNFLSRRPQNTSGILHFGMPKTGSTAIQMTLAKYLAKHHDEFYHVARGFGGVSPNKLVLTLFLESNTVAASKVMDRYGFNKKGLADFQREFGRKFASALRRVGGRTAFMSAEAIPGLSEVSLSQMRDCFIDAGIRPRAVGYIRKPKSYMESSFQQIVKGGWGDFAIQRVFPRYKDRHERVEKVFGSENVNFWLFEPKDFVHGCVVQDFCQKIGLEIRPEDVRSVNESLSFPALSLLYAYRKYDPTQVGKPRGPGVNLMLAKLQELKGSKLRIHSSVVEPLLERQRAQIAWMEERLGASLAEDLGADDATGIKSESDLLSFSPEALQWLAANIEDGVRSTAVLSGNPEDVARGIDALRAELERKSAGLLTKIHRKLITGEE